VLFIISCSTPKTPTSNLLVANKEGVQLQHKVNQAFEDAPLLQEKHSKWYNREEKLPLTIVTTAYIDPATTKTKEYYAYKKLIQKIAKNPALLGEEFNAKYTSIKFVDFAKSADAQRKFQAAYNLQRDDKEKLSDILQPDQEHPSQELLLFLDLEELNKGHLTIRGYKSVKQKNKERNSYFYTLKKQNYANLSTKEKNQALINSLKTALRLSIPEYVSVDRKQLLKTEQPLRFVVPNGDGSFHAEVWRYGIDNQAKSISAQISTLQGEKSHLQEQQQLKIKNYTKEEEIQKYDLKKMYDKKILKVDKYAQNFEIYYGATILKITPKGTHLLAAHDNKLDIWNLSSGKKTTTITSSKEITALEVDPENYFIAIGQKDAKIKLYDLYTGLEFSSIKSPQYGAVESLSWSKDGRYLLSTVRYFDKSYLIYFRLKDQQAIKQYPLDQNTAALHPNGKYALIDTPNNHLKYIDLFSGETLFTTKGGHTNTVQQIHITPNGKYALSSDYAKINYWRLSDGRLLHSFWGSDIKDISISKNGQYALFNDKEGVKYIDLKRKKIIKTNKEKHVRTSVLSPDGKAMAVGHFGMGLKYSSIILSKSQIKKRKKLQAQKKAALAKVDKKIAKKMKSFEKFKQNLQQNYNKKYTLLDKKIALLQQDLKNVHSSKKYRTFSTKQQIYTLPLSIDDQKILYKYNYLLSSPKDTLTQKEINDITYLFDYSFNDPLIGYIFPLYAQRTDLQVEVQDKVLLFDTKTQHSQENLYFTTAINLEDAGYTQIFTNNFTKDRLKNKQKNIAINTDQKGVQCAAISKDKKYAITGGMGANIKYWDLTTGKLLRTLHGGDGRIISVAISDDGVYALSGSFDNVIHYWNLKTGKLIGLLQGHTKVPTQLCFSHDGAYALSGSDDHTIRYWNLKNGKLIHTFEGHHNWISALAISKDDKYALAGSGDKILSYWDLHAETLVDLNKITNSTITSVAISPNGKYAASGTEDGLIKCWELPTMKLLKTIDIWASFSKVGLTKPSIKAIEFLPSGKTLIIANNTQSKSFSYKGYVHFVDIASEVSFGGFLAHNDKINALSLSKDATGVLTGSEDGTIRYWDITLKPLNADF